MDIEFNPVKPNVSYKNFSSFDHNLNTVFTFDEISFNEQKDSNLRRFFPGTYMPIVPTSHYFHFLKEYVGSFLYYRKHINPDVKVLWIDSPTQTLPYHNNLEPIEQVFSLLAQQNVSITYLPLSALYPGQTNTKSCFTFEKLEVIYDSATYIVSAAFPHFEQFRNSNNIEVREFLSHFLVKNPLLPKKIFVTRRSVSDALAKSGQINHISRYNPPHVEDAIEYFFTSKGYEIIDFSGMPLSSQILYMYNASHVAGLMGANTWNGIFCDKGTQFICLKTHMWFHHPYDLDIKSVIDCDFNFVELHELDTYKSVYAELISKADFA